ncbi:MFS transporter [Embleya sp. NPDC001921]
MAPTPATASTTTRRLPGPLRPFGNGRYRLLTGALTLSLIGSGMWLVASVWQVIALGAGPSAMSLVATANGVGLVATALPGGVVADRASRRDVLACTQVAKAAAVASIVLAGLFEALTVPHLAVVAAVLGIADGFFYPAYSALVPSVVADGDLLAANGVEGVLRPTATQAAGPAAASGLIAVFSPGIAFATIALAHLVAAVCVRLLPSYRSPADSPSDPPAPARSAVRDLRAGFAYMLTTPWLVATLGFAVGLVLVISGPIRVLLPFVIRDRAAGGPQDYALALTFFGLGSVIGALAMSSTRLPRRYLTMMLLAWGGGCIPLVAIGLTDRLWVMILALLVCGTVTSSAGVIWGTLLQRRVPATMLGRVSSLDFFVSLSAAPLSVALVGPASTAWGNETVFLIAGTAPPILAVLAVVAARLHRDETEHPLAHTAAPVDTITDPPGVESGDDEHASA